MKIDSIWLVDLEITSERTKLIGFLDFSKSNEFVANFLENLLPIIAEDTWGEKVNLENRFKAKWSFNEPNLISCGIGNPLLVAQKINNVVIKKDGDLRESLEFTSTVTGKTLRFIKAENGDMLFQSEVLK
jgi:hypothetical protein